MSTSKSSKLGKKSLSRSKLKVKPSVGDFNQTLYSNANPKNFNKLKDVKP